MRPSPVSDIMRLAAVTLALGAGQFGCPDATEVATECVQNDIISACPVGSNPTLGASADSACGGEFSGNLIEEGGSASGQCTSAGGCEVPCQFRGRSRGVATITEGNDRMLRVPGPELRRLALRGHRATELRARATRLPAVPRGLRRPLVR